MTRYLIPKIALVALAAVAAHAAVSKGNAGWNDDPSTNYHIQTDEGPERYFRYQTSNGQYRKEKRLEDGTVIGTYGWVDPTGQLLLNDYVADNAGYRIVRTKKVFVGRLEDTAKLATPAAAVVSIPKVVVAATPAPVPVINNAYASPNLYDHPSGSLVKPQAANFNSHPYYDQYEPVIGFQRKPGYQSLKQSYQSSALNSYRTPAVYQPASKPVQVVRVFTPQQQAYLDDQKLRAGVSSQRQQALQQQQQAYDGVSTTQNGFKYYLPRQYHEEKSSADSSEKTGSYGYIDPFGIRRVVYYNSAPGTGFQVKKNNRYVGFESTPYDPRF